MKKICYLLIFISMGALSQSTGVKSNCINCDNNSGDIIFTGYINGGVNPTFTASSAQAYYWQICDNFGVIISSNSNKDVILACSPSPEIFLKLTRFVDGDCIESCFYMQCQ